MKTQHYTLQEIFDKNLLLLIPFYIFSHEERFAEYEKDAAKLKLLQAEYEQIKNKLEELAENGTISEYVKRTIIDMSNKVLVHIAAKYNAVRKGVKDIMGGRVLEYEAKTIKREGIAEGRAQEREASIKSTVSILKNLNIPQQTILANIQEQYHLSCEASKKYL